MAGVVDKVVARAESSMPLDSFGNSADGVDEDEVVTLRRLNCQNWLRMGAKLRFFASSVSLLRERSKTFNYFGCHLSTFHYLSLKTVYGRVDDGILADELAN